MIKHYGALNIILNPQLNQGKYPSHARPVCDALKAVTGAHRIGRAWKSDEHDASNLGRALKKFIVWLRDLFSNE